MSDITPLHRTSAASYSPTGRAKPAVTTTPPASRGADRAEFSSTSQILAKLSQPSEVRQGLVDRVRAEIEAGTYETDAKIDAALDNLIQDLF